MTGRRSEIGGSEEKRDMRQRAEEKRLAYPLAKALWNGG